MFFYILRVQKNIKLDALSVHIGSQILTDMPYKKTLNVMSNLIKDLKLKLKFVDLGGGFGINYSGKDKPINLHKYSSLVHGFSKKLKCKIIFEPGRSIIGNTAILVSKIIYIKQGSNKNFVILDAAMNDLMRPALYDAYHDIVNVSNPTGEHKKYSVVGYICETDTFGWERDLSEVTQGDIICFKNAGAYCFMMASNYNSRYRPAEVLWYNETAHLIRKREVLEDLIKNQILVDF